jgi:hypothetical protein
MANVTIKLNKAGVREMLRSQEMMAICEEQANKALGKLGDGYTVTTMTGKNRVNASIFAETYEAKRDNLKNNSILKALR